VGRPRWVGTGRGASHPVSPIPPPNRAGSVHRTRLSRSPPSPRLLAVQPRSSGSCSPPAPPWGRTGFPALLRFVSTTERPLPGALPRLAGVPNRCVLGHHRGSRSRRLRPEGRGDSPRAFASLRALPMVTILDSCHSHIREVAVTDQPCRLRRLPTVLQGHTGGPAAAFSLSVELRRVRRLLSMPGLSSETREDRGHHPRRMTPASGGFTRGRLSQARPLAGLPPAHRTFQGHAAHLVERSTTLSPNDSCGAWTPARDDRDTAPSSMPRSPFTAHSTGLLGPVESQPTLLFHTA